MCEVRNAKRECRVGGGGKVCRVEVLGAEGGVWGTKRRDSDAVFHEIRK